MFGLPLATIWAFFQKTWFIWAALGLGLAIWGWDTYRCHTCRLEGEQSERAVWEAREKKLRDDLAAEQRQHKTDVSEWEAKYKSMTAERDEAQKKLRAERLARTEPIKKEIKDAANTVEAKKLCPAIPVAVVLRLNAAAALANGATGPPDDSAALARAREGAAAPSLDSFTEDLAGQYDDYADCRQQVKGLQADRADLVRTFDELRATLTKGATPP